MDASVSPQEDLYAVIGKHYSDVVIEETDHPDFGVVTHKDGEMLLFVKKIMGEIAFYNMRISKNAFGPELIHEEDYKRIQQAMQRMELDKCIYVIYSNDKRVYGYQHTFPLDARYLEWIAEQT